VQRLIPLVVVLLTAAATATAATIPHLRSCGGKPLVRPAGIVVLACADANAELAATRWTNWGATRATGTTRFGLNLCIPYCAASKMSFFPRSAVRLDRVKKGRFTRVTVRYVLHGKTRTFVQE
jgi:hypothetical protein